MLCTESAPALGSTLSKTDLSRHSQTFEPALSLPAQAPGIRTAQHRACSLQFLFRQLSCPGAGAGRKFQKCPSSLSRGPHSPADQRQGPYCFKHRQVRKHFVAQLPGQTGQAAVRSHASALTHHSLACHQLAFPQLLLDQSFWLIAHSQAHSQASCAYLVCLNHARQ